MKIDAFVFMFFSFVLLYIPTYAQQNAFVQIAMTYGYQENNQDSRPFKVSYNYVSYDKLSRLRAASLCYLQGNFSRYKAQDFHNYFTRHRYTEKKILSQRCLYMFDEFIKFAQTYTNYKCSLQQLYGELKNLNVFQKAYYIAKGSYCCGLQKRICSLYNQLNVHTNENDVDTKQKIEDSSLGSLSQYCVEYKALGDVCTKYLPSLSIAANKRLDTYNQMIKDSNDLQYVSRSYNISNKNKQLINQYGYDEVSFLQCCGNQLNQILHQESLTLLDHINSLASHSILHHYQEALVNLTVAMVDYNHEKQIDKAMQVGDFCWAILDYGQAILEGVALGAYSAVIDIINNPIEATINIIAGKQVVAYHLCKVLYNVADIGIIALNNVDYAQDKWKKYTQCLDDIIDRVNKKEIAIRDVLKGAAALTVGLGAQIKLLGGLSKFCNMIKQQSMYFLKNNPYINLQEYFTTSQGLLHKAIAQSGQVKQSGQNSASDLKSKLEKCTVWGNIKPTDPMYPGTKIPKSFELTVGGQKFWVCPNATKHMLQYIYGTNEDKIKKVITHNMPMNCQSLLLSFKSELEQAIAQGVQYRMKVKVNCWEFMFSMPRKEGLLTTIYHANFRQKSW